MKLELEIYGCLCATKDFRINGISADSSDFGSQGDSDPDNAEPYGCGNMRFEGKPSTDEVLKAYGISESEYKEIVELLEDKLSFGSCGWCV